MTTIPQATGGRPQIDDRGVAPVDQENRISWRNGAPAAPHKRWPQQQPARNEEDGDKYEVGVIGEKLHVGTAGLGVWRKEKP